jgi:phage gp16-like protein
MPTKSQYYAMIHLGAARLGYTDDADYRAWLENLCGKRSAKDCTLQELASIVATLRLCNALDNPRIKRLSAPARRQWQRYQMLCRQLT